MGSPNNRLRVSHTVSAEFQAYVQNVDRWNGSLAIIAGRTLDEKISITLDGQTAKQLFAQPGSQFDDYRACAKLWDDLIAPHISPSEPER